MVLLSISSQVCWYAGAATKYFTGCEASRLLHRSNYYKDMSFESAFAMRHVFGNSETIQLIQAWSAYFCRDEARVGFMLWAIVLTTSAGHNLEAGPRVDGYMFAKDSFGLQHILDKGKHPINWGQGLTCNEDLHKANMEYSTGLTWRIKTDSLAGNSHMIINICCLIDL
jgi:hypothetical protein